MSKKTQEFLTLTSAVALSLLSDRDGDILPKGTLSQRKLKRIPVYKEGEPVSRTRDEKMKKKQARKKTIKRRKKRGY